MPSTTPPSYQAPSQPPLNGLREPSTSTSRRGQSQARGSHLGISPSNPRVRMLTEPSHGFTLARLTTTGLPYTLPPGALPVTFSSPSFLPAHTGYPATSALPLARGNLDGSGNSRFPASTSFSAAPSVGNINVNMVSYPCLGTVTRGPSPSIVHPWSLPNARGVTLTSADATGRPVNSELVSFPERSIYFFFIIYIGCS